MTEQYVIDEFCDHEGTDWEKLSDLLEPTLRGIDFWQRGVGAFGAQQLELFSTQGGDEDG